MASLIKTRRWKSNCRYAYANWCPPLNQVLPVALGTERPGQRSSLNLQYDRGQVDLNLRIWPPTGFTKLKLCRDGPLIRASAARAAAREQREADCPTPGASNLLDFTCMSFDDLPGRNSQGQKQDQRGKNKIQAASDTVQEPRPAGRQHCRNVDPAATIREMVDHPSHGCGKSFSRRIRSWRRGLSRGMATLPNCRHRPRSRSQ